MRSGLEPPLHSPKGIPCPIRHSPCLAWCWFPSSNLRWGFLCGGNSTSGPFLCAQCQSWIRTSLETSSNQSTSLINSLSFSLPHPGLGAGSRVLFVRTILKSWRFPFLVKEEAGSIFAHTRFPGAKGHWDNIIIKFIICRVQRRRRKKEVRGLWHTSCFLQEARIPTWT